MNENSLNVYTNKTLCGDLTYENEQYIFNYKNEVKETVSITMPIRKASWVSKKLHPIFEMNMPEGALREAIKNHFAKIKNMDDINFLKLI
jgi:serine/threonine-protein kinase HipA